MSRRLIHISLIAASMMISSSLLAQIDSSNIWNLSLEELANIKTVSIGKTSQILKDVPQKIRIITGDQIRERGYTTLDEALADLPGFQFRNIQGFNSYIFMRGLPSQNNLILLMIDGIPVNELNSGGFYGGGHYNLNNVSQIEVTYGPGSLLYGSNAVSGVINIKTKDIKDSEIISLNTTYGSYNTYSLDGAYNYYNPEKELGISVSGMYKYTDKIYLGGDLGGLNWSDEYENFDRCNSFNTKLIYRGLSVGFIYQEKQSSRTTNYKSINTNYSDHGTLWDIRFITSYLNYRKEFNKKSTLNARLHFRDATVKKNTIGYIEKADSVNPGTQVGYYRPNQQYGLEVLFEHKPWKKFDIILGLNVEYEEISNGFGMTYSEDMYTKPEYPDNPEELYNWLGSVFTRLTIRPIKHLSINAGARIDQSTVFGTQISPGASINWTKNRFISKLIYLEAFRAPKNWDYTFGNGNPDLEPEKMRTVEYSAVYYINKIIALDGTVYYNKLYNALYKNQISNRWENKETVNVIGTEIGFVFKNAQKFKGALYYTFNDARYGDNSIVPEISKHMVNASISYRFFNKLSWEFRAYYIGERLNNNLPETIDDAFILNTSLLLSEIGNFRIRLNVNNILDSEYWHTSNTTVDKYRQNGRMFLVNISYNLPQK